MKGGANIISAVHCLAQAKAHFESFCREHPATKGERLFSGYGKKIEWIYKDIQTIPVLPDTVRQGIKAEWESDVFSVPAIAEKSALLNPEQREMVELMIDAMLAGEEVQIVDTNQNSQ